jgi:ABC-type branched-subunit amino acid transport system permease subunit
MSDPVIDPAPSRVERKTIAASIGAYAGAVILLTVLSSVTTDMVSSLPDWIETPVYSLVAAAIAFLSGYVTKHAPGAMSRSAVQAVRGQLGR